MIYADRDKYRDFVRDIAKEICLHASFAFRGECGRDGQPQEDWCFVCRAKDLLKGDQNLPF